MRCLICDEDISITALCDGAGELHAMCSDCASSYLIKTVIPTRSVPKWGENVKCPSPACTGVLSLDMLTFGMDDDNLKKVKEQITKSTTSGFDFAEDVVHCDRCDEYYVRDNENDGCVRCQGSGKLTAMYVKDVSETDYDKKSKEAISKMAIQCPVCGVNINRIDGCNHMKCTRCLNHFCYVCGGDFSSGHYACRFDNPNQKPGTGTYKGNPEPPLHRRLTLEEAQTRMENHTRQAEMRRARYANRADLNDQDNRPLCDYCYTRGSTERCRHLEFMPRQETCQPGCPAECNCEYSRWVASWLNWRPSPGADEEYTDLSKARLDVAFAIVSKTRGTWCRVCGMRGHNPGRSRAHCPLLSLVDNLTTTSEAHAQ